MGQEFSLKEEDKFRDTSIISIVRYSGYGKLNISHTDEGPNGVIKRRKQREN